jgi:hypothetical protein
MIYIKSIQFFESYNLVLLVNNANNAYYWYYHYIRFLIFFYWILYREKIQLLAEYILHPTYIII